MIHPIGARVRITATAKRQFPNLKTKFGNEIGIVRSHRPNGGLIVNFPGKPFEAFRHHSTFEPVHRTSTTPIRTHYQCPSSN